MVKPGDTVLVQFTTHSPTTGGAVNADSLPAGVLVRNGVDDATSVTVTNTGTGVYRASVSVPAGWAPGDEVQIRVTATIGGVSCAGMVWGVTLDGKRVADLNDATAGPSAGAIADAVWDEGRNDHLTAGSMGEAQNRLDAAVTSRAPSTLTESSIASAVWSALLSAMSVAGSVGKKLADWVLGSDSKVLLSSDVHSSGVSVAGVNGGVLANDISTAALTKFVTVNTGQTSAVSGSVAALSGSGGGGGGGTWVVSGFEPAALSQLAGVKVVVSSPVTTVGDIEIVAGDDYRAADGRALEFRNAAGTWPNLTGATIKLTATREGYASLVANGSVVSATGDQKVRVELTATQSRLEPGVWRFDVQATLASGNIVTLTDPERVLRVKKDRSA